MMEARLQSLINDLTLIVKKKLHGIQLGHRHSKKLGSGFIFDQLRDYQPGDDVRSIDWSGYARTSKLFIRTYQEERMYPILIVVDAAYSHAYGSGLRSKYEEIQRIAGLIALVAAQSQQPVELCIIQNNEIQRTGLKTGHAHSMHILTMLSELFPHKQQMPQNLGKLIRTLESQQRVLYVLSDFFTPIERQDLSWLQAKHALHLIRVIDPLEYKAPECFVPISTESQHHYTPLSQYTAVDYIRNQNMLFRSMAIAHCTLFADTDWSTLLRNFLEQKVIYESLPTM